MSPQRDWAEISAKFYGIIIRHATPLTGEEREKLNKLWVLIVQKCQTHKHTEYINEGITATLKPLSQIEIPGRAIMLDKALEAAKIFLQIGRGAT